MDDYCECDPRDNRDWWRTRAEEGRKSGRHIGDVYMVLAHICVSNRQVADHFWRRYLSNLISRDMWRSMVNDMRSLMEENKNA